MKTIKFKANGADLEAEMEVLKLNADQVVVQFHGALCDGEYLDQEEFNHLLETNPDLPIRLGEMLMIELGEIPQH